MEFAKKPPVGLEAEQGFEPSIVLSILLLSPDTPATRHPVAEADVLREVLEFLHSPFISVLF